MSEYWVSHKRYFCKYCDIYIADDAPSRSQHENGMRHKGNKERFVRGLYKAGEKRKKDQEEEKREMMRVEQAAQAAFAQDVGAGHAKLPSTSSAPAPPPKAAAPAKPTNKWANYSTAESLGYQDPDAERLKAEAERRRMVGVAGEWEVVSSISPPPRPDTAEEGTSTPGDSDSRKRAAETETVDEEDGRGFKIRKKTWAGFGDEYDPGAIPIKLKAKKEVLESEGTVTSSSGSVGFVKVEPDALPKATEVPRWKTISLKPGTSATVVQELTPPAVKHEALSTVLPPPDSSAETESLPPPPADPVKQEPKVEDAPSTPSEPPAAGGSMFRKRKGVSGASGRGRRGL
ncbi:hypothetical protein PLICRDRAFT_475297 [Plicaturopsis crispa FD-325 SS-3]|nr:hypothetical protein PLICRDRAFT_475297 [Plicaturopsis crispa FD-325 SS-3]